MASAIKTLLDMVKVDAKPNDSPPSEFKNGGKRIFDMTQNLEKRHFAHIKGSTPFIRRRSITVRLRGLEMKSKANWLQY